MTDAAGKSSGRKIWLCIVLVFLGGLICGCLIGAFFFKRAYRNYSHPRKRVAEVITERIRKDYQLEPAAADRILAELTSFGVILNERVQSARDEVQKLRLEYIDKIAGLLPDDGKRERWSRESGKYLPEPRRIKPPQSERE